MATFVKNKFKCPAGLWRKMRTNKTRSIYNDVMSQSLKNQRIISHPKMPKMSGAQWETICHNFAYLAAIACDGEPLQKGDSVIDIDERTGKELRIRKIA